VRTPAAVRTVIEKGLEFELPGGPDSVLLLHGLTGSTFEMHPVALALAGAGYRCLVPRMAGHDGAAADLAGVPWTEWVAKAWRDLRRLEGARRTFVVGCSMGALVACALAHDHPERVDGLALLSPALELAWSGRIGALLGQTAVLSHLVVPKSAGSDVRDDAMRAANPGLDGVSLSAVAELHAFAAQVDRMLPGIAAPALVLAGGKDRTVTVAGARRLARRIGSGPAEVVVLPESGHLVGIDVDREEVADRVVRFLDALPVPGASGREATRRRDARRPRPHARGGKKR
jgi:carboxylesterase